MAITVKATSTGNVATGTAVSSSFGANVSSGNGVVVCISSASADPTSITDGTNTYTKVKTANFFGTNFASIWYCGNPTGGFTTITANSSSSQQVYIVGAEVYGVLTAAQNNGASGNSAAATPGSITTTTADTIIFAKVSTSNLSTQPTGYTSIYMPNAPSAVSGNAYKVRTTTGSENGAWTATSSSPFGCVQVAFTSTNTTGPATGPTSNGAAGIYVV